MTQLPPQELVPLRDSLLAALRTAATQGPRVIVTQIAIALADLALQLTPEQWPDPTSYMIQLLGTQPAMAPALLEFLQVLAEEYNSNMKLVVVNDLGRGGASSRARADQLVALLSMYIQAPGLTVALQNQCFICLGAWLRTGQAPAAALTNTPILDAAFRALADDQLFDCAVDLLVDVVHETQELDDNVQIIQALVPRLIELRQLVVDPAVRDDEDRLRGYCRILVEAGEWYVSLITQHQDSFLPLVQAIAACAATDNLEIVEITVNFWYRLSRELRRVKASAPASPALLEVFSDLVQTIIGHLHYPSDEKTLVGQERDTFRSFRHTIGDTLKDCCSILGATTCLRRSYDLIISKLATNPGATKWQEIEAPLFSMRTMGAEVDPREHDVMPQIMQLLPTLPPHPKIRYASILVIGRYTQWLDYHPETIQTQLPYISSGFDLADADLTAAAAQTMKYLCKDCPTHLVPFLPSLLTFIQTLTDKVAPEDLLDLSAAIGHIIAVMPSGDAPQALSTFCMPNVETVHRVTTQPTAATKEQLRAVADALDRIDMLVATVDRLPDGIPPACASTCSQVWAVIDALLAKYGSNPMIADKSSIVLRRGLYFFEQGPAYDVAPAVLDRLASSFELYPSSSYLWVTSKIVTAFHRAPDASFHTAVTTAFERQTVKVFALLQSTAPAQIGDGQSAFTEHVDETAMTDPAQICLQSSTTTCISSQI